MKDSNNNCDERKRLQREEGQIVEGSYTGKEKQ